MRPCHASSKTSSPFFLGNAAWPDMSAISRLGTESIELPSDQRAAGAGTTATPIIASRVTSSASAASLRRSVPGGRCGRTRYRSSALESQIRISTLSGRSTPNSRNTTRGSRTARERYSNDLYQTGGSPARGGGEQEESGENTRVWEAGGVLI